MTDSIGLTFYDTIKSGVGIMRKLCFFVCLLAWILAIYPLVYADISAPELVEPRDGEMLIKEVLFKWKASPGANSYTLQILNPIDQTIVFETKTSQNQHQLSSGTLSMSTPYYRQVKAADASGESDWSGTWGF
jgi:hypothetical protein